MVSCLLTDSGVTVGALVKLETINGSVVEGIVLSFDKDFKFLVLDPKEKTVNKPLIRIFNVQHLKYFQVKRLSSAENDEIAYAAKKNEQFALAASDVTSKSTADRFEKMMREVAPNLMASSGVSIHGQQVYLQLKRTIPDTRWAGDQIRVLGSVLVSAPYGADNVSKDAKATGFDESRVATTIAQVQKILAKPLTEHKSRPPLDFAAVATN